MGNAKLIPALMLLAAACGSNPNRYPTTEALVGPTGGSLSADNGRLRLDFPAGAVRTATTITARRVDVAPPGLVGYELGPDGLTFETRPRITIQLDEAVDPARHAIAKRRSDGTYELDSIPEFDSAARTVSATLTGFSDHIAIRCPLGCPIGVDNVDASPQANGSMRVSWRFITGGGSAESFSIERAVVTSFNQDGGYVPLVNLGNGDLREYFDLQQCYLNVYRYRVRPFAVATYGAAGESPQRLSSSQTQCSTPSPDGGTTFDGGGSSLCSLVSVSTLAGSGQMGSTDGPANIATFRGPNGIAIASTGDVYVNDGNAVRRISAGGTVSTFARYGTPGINSLSRLAIAPTDKLFFTTSDNLVYTLDASGTPTLLAGSTFGYQDGTGPNARFAGPFGIVVHPNGTAYVADLGNRRIRAITPAGVTTTLAGSGQNGSADGVGTAASFSVPSYLALSGNVLYVVDYGNNSIRQVDITTGRVTTRVSSSVLGPQAKLSGIAVDSFGNLLFMSHNGSTLNLLAAGSSSPERLAGAPIEVVGQFADGVGCDARFDGVEGIALSGRRLVLADSRNYRVRQTTIR